MKSISHPQHDSVAQQGVEFVPRDPARHPSTRRHLLPLNCLTATHLLSTAGEKLNFTFDILPLVSILFPLRTDLKDSLHTIRIHKVDLSAEIPVDSPLIQQRSQVVSGTNLSKALKWLLKSHLSVNASPFPDIRYMNPLFGS
eukprot:755167-Hanusia_phi.AAC.5